MTSPTAAPDGPPGPEPMPFGAALDALRDRGAHRADPVRFRFIESMARRTAAHQGDARRLLDDRVARLLAAFGDQVDRAPATGNEVDDLHPASRPTRGALAELIDHLARPAPASTRQGHHQARTDASPQATESPAGLESLHRYLSRTWSRLSADQRLAESLSTLPENAGPLNSRQLVHRALTLMKDLSPEYLDRFISHVDALLWLESASEGGAKESVQGARGDGERKPARSARLT